MPLSIEQKEIYFSILSEELQVATGCTEPIAIAYAAAKARQVLGVPAQRYTARVSGNVLKNAKAVTVPNTGGLKGIEASVLAGAIAGRPDGELEVLSSVEPSHYAEIREGVERRLVTVCLLRSSFDLHIQIECFSGNLSSMVEITQFHTHISRILQNGKCIFEDLNTTSAGGLTNRDTLNVRDILEFADTADLEKIRPIIEKQICMNSAISEAGLSGNWGVHVGKTLMSGVLADGDIHTRAKARTAAGADARMGGCPMPVVTNSGSGNQGMCVSLPVIEYARHSNAKRDRLIRALIVSNLVSIHQKTGIGRLSAYCGAVSAAAGSGAGIAYLEGKGYECIAQTIVNTIANVGGLVCDGAKPSCAAKVASSVDAALMGYKLASLGYGFQCGEGLVGSDVEKTISDVGKIARSGMKKTDNDILKIMVGYRQPAKPLKKIENF